ncbi:hypothetical protein ABW19_dt0203654 [Dactylella cylindrospora]|nr:hypothetical protein ABW19_dt0203654 [Dactylella cylindrospora]
MAGQADLGFVHPSSYEPWSYFATREPSNFTVYIYPFAESKDHPPGEILATYRLHQRILYQSPTFIRWFEHQNPEDIPNTQLKLKLYGEEPHIFAPIIAYLYLHDIDYLSASYSRWPHIKNAKSQLKPPKTGSYHNNSFSDRMLYYINLYFLAARLELDQLCELLVERYIKVYDVPATGDDTAEAQEGKYNAGTKHNPFNLYDMPDRVKDQYIQSVYTKYVKPMVIEEKGNLKWGIVEGILGRKEIKETFEFQFEDFPGFFEDVMAGLRERRRHQLYEQYLEIVEWSEDIEERRKSLVALKRKYDTEGGNDVSNSEFKEDGANTVPEPDPMDEDDIEDEEL